MATKSLFEESLKSFSHDIYQDTNGTINACMSPFSIISAFLMLMIGTGGSSKSQIKSTIVNNNWNDQMIYHHYQALEAKVFNTKEIELSIATKLFVKKGLRLKKKVRKAARVYFKAGIENLDFKKSKRSAHIINSYIARRTNNRIIDVIEPSLLNDMTVMVLVNTLYFKGEWETQFDPRFTNREDFSLTKRKKIKVDMMASAFSVRYYNGKSFSAIALPYKGKEYEMIIILPSLTDGLKDLKNSFSSSVANAIESGLEENYLFVKIPKFEFEFEIDLKEDLLPKLGVTDIFLPDIADFSNLIRNVETKIYVSEAKHNVFINVNELGTEAAAATIIITGLTGPPPPKQFIADHPFMFYIRHVQTSSILFIGHFVGLA